MRTTRIAVVVAAAVAAAVPVAQAKGPAGATKVAISVKAPPWTTWGSRVGITGTVKPLVPGMAVVLQQQEGRRWAPVASSRVRANGVFLLVARPRKPVTTSYRVVTPVASKRVVGASKTFSIRVLQWSWLGDLSYVDSDSYGVNSNPITVNGVSYAHPVYFSACCGEDRWVEWNLNRTAQRFAANMGIDDAAPTGTTASYQVIVDGATVASGNLSLGMVAPIDVSVAGAFRMRLVVNVTNAPDDDDTRYVVFGNARLLGPPPPKS